MIEGYTKYYCQWCLRDIHPEQMEVRKGKGKIYRYPRKVNGRIVCYTCYSYHWQRKRNMKMSNPKMNIEIRRQRGLWVKILQQA